MVLIFTKFSYFLILLLINQSFSQEFVKTGTGVKGIDLQYLIKGMDYGCKFMAICVKGGLSSTEEILQAKEWAIKNDYINDGKLSIKIDSDLLAKYISEHFKTVLHPEFHLEIGYHSHYYLLNDKDEEIFNSYGLGNLI